MAGLLRLDVGEIVGGVKMLEGKKTYLAAAGGAIVAFALMLGWIDREMAEALWGLLGFGGLAALRQGVEKK